MISYNLGDIILIQFPHTDMADFKVTNWQKCGLLAESYVRLGKQATIEKQYIVRKLGVLNTPAINKIRSIIRKMFSL